MKNTAPTQTPLTRRALIASVVAIGLSATLPDAARAQATREQRLALINSGSILNGATIIASLEAQGGQVIDMDLYLPSNQPASWYYRVIFRSNSGQVSTVDISAVTGGRMTR